MFVNSMIVAHRRRSRAGSISASVYSIGSRPVFLAAKDDKKKPLPTHQKKEVISLSKAVELSLLMKDKQQQKQQQFLKPFGFEFSEYIKELSQKYSKPSYMSTFLKSFDHHRHHHHSAGDLFQHHDHSFHLSDSSQHHEHSPQHNDQSHHRINASSHHHDLSTEEARVHSDSFSALSIISHIQSSVYSEISNSTDTETHHSNLLSHHHSSHPYGYVDADILSFIPIFEAKLDSKSFILSYPNFHISHQDIRHMLTHFINHHVQFIKHLKLTGLGLKYHGASMLVDQEHSRLHHIEHLLELDLSLNRLGDRGLVGIMNALNRCKGCLIVE